MASKASRVVESASLAYRTALGSILAKQTQQDLILEVCLTTGCMKGRQHRAVTLLDDPTVLQGAQRKEAWYSGKLEPMPTVRRQPVWRAMTSPLGWARLKGVPSSDTFLSAQSSEGLLTSQKIRRQCQKILQTIQKPHLCAPRSETNYEKKGRMCYDSCGRLNNPTSVSTTKTELLPFLQSVSSFFKGRVDWIKKSYVYFGWNSLAML